MRHAGAGLESPAACGGTGGKVSSGDTSVPHPLGWCILVCGCWGPRCVWASGRCTGTAGAPCTPKPASPVLGQRTQPPRSPVPGTQQLSPPGSPRPGGERDVRWAAGRGWGHHSVLPISTGSWEQVPSSPRPATTLCPVLRATPRPPVPHPCLAGSPQPSRQFRRAVWAGRAHDGLVPSALSTAGAAVTRCRCLCRHHGRFLRSLHHAMGTATDTLANDEFLLLRSLESPHVQRGTHSHMT